jgi:hypothetical protein
VFAAAGGNEHWDQARELRWTQTPVTPGASLTPDEPSPLRSRSGSATPSNPTGAQDHLLDRPTGAQDHLWDRWNGRYAVREHHDHHDGLDTAMIFEIYGDAVRAVGATSKGKVLPLKITSEGSGGARAMWHVNTTLVCLPFLLREPGVRLEYLEPSYGEDGELDNLRVTFAARDRMRSGSALDVGVNKANVVVRVSIETLATHERVAYDLRDWVTVAGLAIPTTRLALASGETTHLTAITIGPTVNDDDFVWPRMR